MNAESTQVFIKEMKRFEFFRDQIWPRLRHLAQPFLSNRCKNCNLSENYMPLDDELCVYCNGKKVFNADLPIINEKENGKTKFNDYIDSYIGKGKGSFDGVVLFSGGKDSSLLVSMLQELFPSLRLQALFVDNNFTSPIAKSNVEFTIRKLNIPLTIIKPAVGYTQKAYAHAFRHIGPGGAAMTVDQLDGDFVHDIARNFAHKNNIPLVFSGLSQVQVQKILKLNTFHTLKSHEQIPRTIVGNLSLKDFSTEEELKTYWWQGAPKPPLLVFPYFVWNLEEEVIKHRVNDLGLGELTHQSPVLTNSQLIGLMGVVDICQRGYSSFEPEFCENVRRGKSDKNLWLHTFEFLEFCAVSGLFLDKIIDETLNELALSRKELGIEPKLKNALLEELIPKVLKAYEGLKAF